MKKKLICAILAGVLSLTPALAADKLLTVSVGNDGAFPTVNAYPGFWDVKESDWFYNNVKLCYETGLLIGSHEGFLPGDSLSVSEVASIAARMNQTLTGVLIPAAEAGQPWFVPYVDYLGLLGVDLPENVDQPVTRLEFVTILSAVLPDSVLPAINNVTTLPDTNSPDVLRFYNAGILVGNDAYGTFAPQSTLLRSECAAIVSRVARTSLRLVASLTDYTPFQAAGMAPWTALVQNGATARDYLPRVMERIAALERRDEELGEEFNWFHTLEDGTTYLNSVKRGALTDLGVELDANGTPVGATAAYNNFDVQVFYSRYIGLTGETL